ncbi:MAG: hypothetical protein A2277_15205 [Desulfobacterales bacterium RIFOXYA12_FULL_46_15]|nr:MAG: hypothetical protein A2277_15205 [Desulfobacterales bacterium RIFOXYA12_FULL_46_15]
MKSCFQINFKGFTLIEIMVVLTISGILLSGIVMFFTNQQKSFINTTRVSEMQQNIRAATIIMSAEIREAGCDPTENTNAGIISATVSQLHFTRDIIGDTVLPNKADGELNDANEDITFGFSQANDANSDGIADAGAADLGRNTGGAFQPIAENIHAVEFNYILEDGTRTTAPSAFQLPLIRSVQISILARESARDKDFFNTITYTTGSGAVWGPFNDNFKRRFTTVTIQCRNLGI